MSHLTHPPVDVSGVRIAYREQGDGPPLAALASAYAGGAGSVRAFLRTTS